MEKYWRLYSKLFHSFVFINLLSTWWTDFITLQITLLFNNLHFPRNFSAKSRIKGTLEIYHAFVKDTPDSAASSLNENEWEVVENGVTQTNVAVSTTVRDMFVNLKLTYRFSFIELFCIKSCSRAFASGLGRTARC